MENCCRFVFYDNKEKLRAELVLFSIEKARVTIATSQSVRGNFDSYCKMPYCPAALSFIHQSMNLYTHRHRKQSQLRVTGFIINFW